MSRSYKTFTRHERMNDAARVSARVIMTLLKKEDESKLDLLAGNQPTDKEWGTGRDREPAWVSTKLVRRVLWKHRSRAEARKRLRAYCPTTFGVEAGLKNETLDISFNKAPEARYVNFFLDGDVVLHRGEVKEVTMGGRKLPSYEPASPSYGYHLYDLSVKVNNLAKEITKTEKWIRFVEDGNDANRTLLLVSLKSALNKLTKEYNTAFDSFKKAKAENDNKG